MNTAISCVVNPFVSVKYFFRKIRLGTADVVEQTVHVQDILLVVVKKKYLYSKYPIVVVNTAVYIQDIL